MRRALVAGVVAWLALLAAAPAIAEVPLCPLWEPCGHQGARCAYRGEQLLEANLLAGSEVSSEGQSSAPAAGEGRSNDEAPERAALRRCAEELLRRACDEGSGCFALGRLRWSSGQRWSGAGRMLLGLVVDVWRRPWRFTATRPLALLLLFAFVDLLALALRAGGRARDALRDTILLAVVGAGPVLFFAAHEAELGRWALLGAALGRLALAGPVARRWWRPRPARPLLWLAASTAATVALGALLASRFP